MHTNEIPMMHRFCSDSFDEHELEIIVGAINRYGQSILRATLGNLHHFTWEQVKQSLLLSRRECLGDSRDDVDDVLYNLRDAQRDMVEVDCA